MDENKEEIPFDNDREEEMRLENDILKLKLQAEFGADRAPQQHICSRGIIGPLRGWRSALSWRVIAAPPR